jgi:hypothetical protein
MQLSLDKTRTTNHLLLLNTQYHRVLLSLFHTEPVTSFKLPLREETIDCPTTSSTTEKPTNTEGNAADNRPRIVIDNGVSHDINPPTSFPQKAIQYGEGPSYTPLASSGGGIDIFGSPSTTPSPGSTAGI